MANAKTELPMVSRNYKDTVFRKLFSNKEALLHLYNAVMDTNYEELDDLEITDTENPIYIGMRNDVAFVADFQVHLYEHQSTMNPNMPLRDLFYVSQLYGKILGEKNIYSRTPVLLPTPNFIVFYNGIQKHPETLEYRLSDLYVMKKDIPQMELRVRVININAGCNERLVSQCKELKGYQSFVEKVRFYQKTVDLERANERTVGESIDEGILKEFFLKYRKEIVSMSLWEFDQKKYDDMLREEGREEGLSIYNSLVSCLIQDDRMEDLKESLNSPVYRRQLLQEYGLA